MYNTRDWIAHDTKGGGQKSRANVIDRFTSLSGRRNKWKRDEFDSR